MWYLWLILGVIIGAVVTIIVMCKLTTYGTLKIDHSDPEKDIYRFDVDDIDKLSKKKRVVLYVDNHANLSQK